MHKVLRTFEKRSCCCKLKAAFRGLSVTQVAFWVSGAVLNILCSLRRASSRPPRVWVTLWSFSFSLGEDPLEDEGWITASWMHVPNIITVLGGLSLFMQVKCIINTRGQGRVGSTAADGQRPVSITGDCPWLCAWLETLGPTEFEVGPSQKQDPGNQGLWMSPCRGCLVLHEVLCVLVRQWLLGQSAPLIPAGTGRRVQQLTKFHCRVAITSPSVCWEVWNTDICLDKPWKDDI